MFRVSSGNEEEEEAGKRERFSLPPSATEINDTHK